MPRSLRPACVRGLTTAAVLRSRADLTPLILSCACSAFLPGSKLAHTVTQLGGFPAVFRRFFGSCSVRRRCVSLYKTVTFCWWRERLAIILIRCMQVLVSVPTRNDEHAQTARLRASTALGVQDPRLSDRALSVSVEQEFGIPASVWQTRAIRSTTGGEMPASKKRAADSALDTQGSSSSKRARQETTPQIASEHRPKRFDW